MRSALKNGSFALAGWLLAAFSAALLADEPPLDSTFELTRNLVYRQFDDGTQLRCDIWRQQSAGPHPAVLCVHGGAWATGNKNQMRHVAERLAQAGYVAISINYRLAPKYLFPAQIEDCRAAVRWLRDHADEFNIDRDRLAAYGYSAGGHLVSLLATQPLAARADETIDEKALREARLQCVVAGGAPCDFRELPPDAKFLSYWLGGTRAEKPEQYELASPRKFITAAAPPAFYYHGQFDLLVPRESPQQMVESLKQAGVKASLYVVPNVEHAAALFASQGIDRAIEFLDAELKQK
jgi:acetyl esterase/lipase